jgi:hypothetical protein
MIITGMYLTILKALVFIAGFMDAYKYKLMTLKISKLKSSKEISRNFLNWSIFNRVILLVYVWFVLKDALLALVSIIALYTMLEAFYAVYEHYPYKHRNLKNFKKPTIWKYLTNSLRPNKKRKKL